MRLLTVETDGAVRLAAGIFRYTFVGSVIALLNAGDGQSHVRLVRGYSDDVLRVVFAGLVNHLAVLSRPVVERAGVRLRETFQRYGVGERRPDQLMRYPQHRGNCNNNNSALAID